MHHDPQYYRIRNHLVDFLVERSKLYQTGARARRLDPKRPPVVTPGLEPEPPPSDLRPPRAAQVVNLRH